MKKIFIINLLVVLSYFHLSSQNAYKAYEGYYLKQDTYPNDESTFWFQENTEVQGVTNDGQNWFITVTGHTDISGPSEWGELWKIPKDVPLGINSTSNPNVESIAMADIPILDANTYWHWGDPDHFNFNGTNYILVPMYPPSGNGIIACFKADPFEFISYTNIPYRPGWCAVDNDGFLYGSPNYASVLWKYEVDWDLLTSYNNNNYNLLNLISTINLSFTGDSYDELKHMQGGEFSDSDALLYLVSGSAGCLWIAADPEPSDGIHVFDTSNWAEIESSINTNSGFSYFNYTFNNGCSGQQSPEGLTIWNLEDGSINEFTGGLHILIFDWNVGGFSGNNDHDVSMFHFSHNIYVDKNNGVEPPSNPLTGTQTNPFQTVNDAYNFYPIWDGAQMVIKEGIYNDTGVYSTRIRMISNGGSAIIGQQ